MTKTQKPKLLDFYSCSKGTSMGYSRAGFDVYGADLFEKYNQKRYPFPSFKGDALEVLDRLLAGEKLEFVKWDRKKFISDATLGLSDFVAFVGSPPCQHASVGTEALRKAGKVYPKMIEPTREKFILSGLPYIIENVKGAKLIDPVELCGCMFNLQTIDTDGTLLHLQRIRLFESNIPLTNPRPHDHSYQKQWAGSYGGARRDKIEARTIRKGGYVPSAEKQRELLGITWPSMTQAGMYQCLPPAYTQHLGKQLMKYIKKASRTS